MTTFAASQHSAEPGGVAGDAVSRRSSRRDKIEALGLLLGMLGSLLSLALTARGGRLTAQLRPAVPG